MNTIPGENVFMCKKIVASEVESAQDVANNLKFDLHSTAFEYINPIAVGN